MRVLGRFLQELSVLPQRSFSDFLCTEAGRAFKANIVYAERRLEEQRGAPAYWIDDLRNYQQTAKEAMAQPDFFVPSDLEGSAVERLSLFQDLVSRFGTLLIHWPDIVEAAMVLRAKGHRLTTAV